MCGGPALSARGVCGPALFARWVCGDCESLAAGACASLTSFCGGRGDCGFGFPATGLGTLAVAVVVAVVVAVAGAAFF